MAGDLFQSSGLEQDTGLLNERWNQEGSEPIDALGEASNTTSTIYTVTAGKVLYITNFVMTQRNTSAGVYQPCTLRDDTANKIVVRQLENTTEHVSFPSPVKFETSVVMVITGDWSVTIVGWEEDPQ